MTDTQTVDAPVQSLPGFVAEPRYRRVECDWFPPKAGAQPLFAEIRSDLPFGYLSDIPLGGESSYQELWTVISQHVRSWNALGLDLTTGEYKPVPPPAEIGIEAFRAVDPLIGIWIGTMLKQTYAQAVANPKASSGSKTPAGGPSKANEGDSASSNRATKSRPNRSA